MTMLDSPRRRRSRGAIFILAVALFLGVPLQDGAAIEGRDYVRVIGAPEVLPYPAAVANVLAQGARRKFPQIEQAAENGALAEFCGKKLDSPDVLIIPVRDDLPSNTQFCTTRLDLLVLPFGRQVVTLYTAATATPFALTRDQLYRAIAAQLPRRDATGLSPDMFGPNPNMRWRDISPDLPDEPIRLVGPPQRSVFWLIVEDLLMRPACLEHPKVAELFQLDEALALRPCLSRRSDAAMAYVDGAAYNASPRITPRGSEIVINDRRAMLLSPEATMLAINDVVPNDEALGARRYVLSRQITAVVRADRMGSVPNLREFVREITSPAAAGPRGYLAVAGLDPLPRNALSESALAATLTRPAAPPRDDKPAPR